MFLWSYYQTMAPRVNGEIVSTRISIPPPIPRLLREAPGWYRSSQNSSEPAARRGFTSEFSVFRRVRCPTSPSCTDEKLPTSHLLTEPFAGKKAKLPLQPAVRLHLDDKNLVKRGTYAVVTPRHKPQLS
jgi:hypothetical protein